MPTDLTDRSIFITGASSGIGAATAVAAAKAGMNCALFARRREPMETVARRIEAAGRRALVLPGNVQDPAAVRAAIEQAAEAFGRLDAVFANAGYGFMKSVEDLAEAEHRQIFDVNYFGTVHALQAAIPIMRRAGGGHLLITSSIVARVGIPHYAAYSATKAAQDALATALRVELEPDGIELTSIYPIGTRTEFFEVSARIGGRDRIEENTPQALMQPPEHVARRIVKALRRPVPEVWPACWSHWASSLACMFPRLTRTALRAHARHDREAGS